MLLMDVFSYFLDSLKHRGVLSALAALLRRSAVFIRDLAPSRRRMRYGDIQFDFDHSVDTTWANLPLRTRAREILMDAQYQATDPVVFGELMQCFAIDHSKFTFVDLGSGKGRVLLMAAEYPFKRIIGVELLPELSAVAEANLRRVRERASEISTNQIELRLGDARDFEFPNEPLLVYLFNPFPEFVVRRVLGNLEESIRRHPRPVYVAFHNNVYADVFTSVPSLRKVAESPAYVIYASPG